MKSNSKPVILTLDDDPNVLRAVERDLRRQYSSDYRVARAESGQSALELLEALKRRGESSALFLVDQRMPQMTGVEFLEKAADLYPEARRVLLTAYADTDAAIRAINQVHIDHYLLKPWDPPKEKLYPVLTDLLDDWRLGYEPVFGGIRVVGHQWEPASHQVKDFLTRNNIPYLWLDIDRSGDAIFLVESANLRARDLPCLFFQDGSVLRRPDNRAIAERVGLQTVADHPLYDLIVIGAGPAGLAAAVYGASEGLRTIVVEHQAPGGQAGTSSRIENYLGFPGGISGGELARRAVTQARRFGVEILTAQEVVGLVADGPSRTVKLGDGNELRCRAVIIATGVTYRHLEAKGIQELTGAGVYYGAAMSEGESVRDKDVYIVGGANSAGQAAMYFSRFANQVTMLVRGESLSSSMSQYLIDQIAATENIRLLTQTQVQEAIGSDRLERLVLRRNGTEETVSASALFVFIGAVPHTHWLRDAVERDSHGFIFSGLDAQAHDVGARGPSAGPRRSGTERRSSFMQRRSSLMMSPMAVTDSHHTYIPALLETSLPGVFVAGDVRHGSVKRVASAVGEGSMAVMYVHQYLSST
jgi:thioredoxin reductase (NADPH)